MAQRGKHPGHLLRSWIEKDASMTQQWVADRLGCRQSTLNDIMQGRRRPSLRLAARIQELTGIPASTFAEVA